MKIKFTLITIFILALFLRLYGLKNVPAILNRDEAALAYNAYLLYETGFDEWHQRADVALESFGDYKLIGYPAILTIFYRFLPLNDLTVKLPSVLAGTFLVVLTYFLARNFKISKQYSVIASFLVAINPVFIFYSRMAYEANVALFLFAFGFYLLTLEIKNSKRFVVDLLSSILFLLATLTYNTPLLLIPFLIGFVILFRGVRKYSKWLPLVIGLFVVFGTVFMRLSPLIERKNDITIFSDALTWSKYLKYRDNLPAVFSLLFASKYFYYFKIISTKILESFSPWFLVQNGGTNPWHSAPGWGHLQIPTYVFSIVGMVIIFIESLKVRFKLNSKNRKLLLLGIFTIAALAPAVITTDAPHATRSLFFLFFLIIFATIGLERFIVILRNKVKNKASMALGKYMIFLFITSSLLITGNYMYEYLGTGFKIDHLGNYFVGFDTIVQKIDLDYSDQKEIAIVDSSGYQYILLSWYLKINPEVFFNTIVKQDPDRIGFRYGQQVKNYHFIASSEDRVANESVLIQWNEDKKNWEVINY